MHLSASLILVFVALLLLTRFWHVLDARLAASAAGFDEALAELRNFPAVIDRRLQPRRPVDLCRLIEEMPLDCESLLRGSGIEVQARIGAGPLLVLARRDELAQLLAHLAIIATHAMPRGGLLGLRLGVEPRPAEPGEPRPGAQQMALLELHDCDHAGSEPLLAALYQHGAQGASTGGAAIEATYGALAASVASCRRIVAAHEGRIDALLPAGLGAAAGSEAAGLRIRLPLHAPAPPARSARAAAAGIESATSL